MIDHLRLKIHLFSKISLINQERIPSNQIHLKATSTMTQLKLIGSKLKCGFYVGSSNLNTFTNTPKFIK